MKRILAPIIFSSQKSRTKILYESFRDKLRASGQQFDLREVDLLNQELAPRPLSRDDLIERLKAPNLETQMLLDHDRFLFAFPIWNFGLPAQLKAFVDRAVTPGFTYSFGPSGVESELEGKSALILCVAGGDYENQPSPHQSLVSILTFLKVRTVEVFIDKLDVLGPDQAHSRLSPNWSLVSQDFLNDFSSSEPR